MQAWTTGHYTARFVDADDLRDAVTAALRDLELSRAVGPVDESEMLGRAQALMPDDRQSQGAQLILAVAGGPRQQVVRPRDLESPALEEALTQEAFFGSARVLDRTAETRHTISGDAELLEEWTKCVWRNDDLNERFAAATHRLGRLQTRWSRRGLLLLQQDVGLIL